MFASVSTSSNQKTGKEWTSRIYFDPIAGEVGPLQEVTDRDLRQRMEAMIDGEEWIEKIWVYKCPLYDWQLTDWFLNHQFVVLETNGWWWSIEKNSEGITVQRGKNHNNVRNRYRRQNRKSGIKEMSSDEGRGTMRDLVNWLYEKNELNKEYHWIDENCKHFAKRLFDKFAKTKYHFTL